MKEIVNQIDLRNKSRKQKERIKKKYSEESCQKINDIFFIRLKFAYVRVRKRELRKQKYLFLRTKN
jgi:hypothetical protein